MLQFNEKRIHDASREKYKCSTRYKLFRNIFSLSFKDRISFYTHRDERYAHVHLSNNPFPEYLNPIPLS